MRNDLEPGTARVNVVSIPDNFTPKSPMDFGLYKVTYQFTYHFTNSIKYSESNIGNRKGIQIGKKVIDVTVQNPRQLRALAILSSGIDAIKRIGENEYRVKSQSKDGYYNTIFTKIGWECDCPNFKEYHSDCKHIYAVQFSIQLRLDVEKNVSNEVIKVEHVTECPECKSIEVVRNGQRKCKKGINQRFLCKSCGHRFVTDKELSRLKAKPDVICVAMDLYFKGNSLAKIKHHLKMFYKIDVSRPTVMRWVHKFSKILSDYSDRHTPDVGDLWNTDEMSVPIRVDGVKKNLDWIWNLMDSDTRFLLASTISKERYVKDARKVLKQGKDRAGKKPNVLITDGLLAYIVANRKEFYSQRDPTIHFRTQAKRKYFLNQNIERLNGTIRERIKVMRGLDSAETGQTILDGERFYYNYIRPHTSLNGMTPAQMANLGMVEPDDNPWLVLIKKALKESV